MPRSSSLLSSQVSSVNKHYAKPKVHNVHARNKTLAKPFVQSQQSHSYFQQSTEIAQQYIDHRNIKNEYNDENNNISNFEIVLDNLSTNSFTVPASDLLSSPSTIVSVDLHTLSYFDERKRCYNLVEQDNKTCNTISHLVEDKSCQIIVSFTNLDAEQMVKLLKCLQLFSIRLTENNEIDVTTTHLITDDSQEHLVCTLTRKTFQAVARHLFVISHRWLDECLKQNRIIDERPYEIHGDLSLSKHHNGFGFSRVLRRPLFQNLYSVVVDCDHFQNIINKQELIELIQLCGAISVDKNFDFSDNQQTYVILCEEKYLKDHYYHERYKDEKNIHIVSPEWLLESIAKYEIQPFDEYEKSIS